MWFSEIFLLEASTISDEQLISSNFQNGTFEIITIIVTKTVLIQAFFLPLLLSKRNENEKTESIVAPYYSKISFTQNQGVPFFCCLGHGT